MTSSLLGRELLLVEPARLAGDRKLLAQILPICREINFRRNHPFYTYRPDSHPQGNQIGFHQARASVRVVLGGGQSGKSRAAAQEIAWWLTEKHPWQPTPKCPRIYVISAGYRLVQEGVYKHLKYILPRWLIHEEGPRVMPWQFPLYIQMNSGAQVDFISGEGGEDARRKVQAAEVDLLVIDEEVDGLLWEESQRARLARGGRAIVSLTAIRSEPWITSLEDMAEMGDPHVHLTRLSTYRARDRGHVKAEIVKEMEMTLSESDRQVRLEGRTRRYEGLIYPEFGKLNVCPPFEIPQDCTRYVAIDPGYRTCAILYAAVWKDGKYVLYREIYLHARDYHEVATSMLRAEGYNPLPGGMTWARDLHKTEKMEVRWMDPSGFGHHESGGLRIGTILALYSKKLGVGNALAPSPAPNDVEAGIELCRRALAPDMDGVPKMRVFDTCINFIREVRGYRRLRDKGQTSKDMAKDRPLKRNDHGCDAWRYLELGGLEWKEPEPASQGEDWFMDDVATGLEERMRRHRARLAEERKYGPVHWSGLGAGL